MWFIKSHPISAQVGMDVRAENTKLIRSVAFAVASICDLDHIFSQNTGSNVFVSKLNTSVANR